MQERKENRAAEADDAASGKRLAASAHRWCIGASVEVDTVAMYIDRYGGGPQWRGATVVAHLAPEANCAEVYTLRLNDEAREWGAYAQHMRAPRRPPVTDDSGRESREPARVTPERVRSLLEAAAPGPWTHEGRGWVALGPLAQGTPRERMWRGADADLVAAAPDIARAYPEACAERDAARQSFGESARRVLDETQRALARAVKMAEAESERASAAYARGALDMRTRAAAVARDSGTLVANGYADTSDYDNGRDDAAEGIADAIEALDVEVPQ